MKKTIAKKLSLSAETLRSLTASQMRGAFGGIETDPTNSGDAYCPTTGGYPSCDNTCTTGPVMTLQCGPSYTCHRTCPTIPDLP